MAKKVKAKKRDFEKEAAWQRTKYEQFKFLIEKELGLALRKHVADCGIKITDWFREKINEDIQLVPVAKNQLVPVAEKQLVPVKPKQKNKPPPDTEMVQEWLKLLTTGISQADIARKFGYSPATVCRSLKKAKNIG